jgi:hypothetical protein
MKTTIFFLNEWNKRGVENYLKTIKTQLAITTITFLLVSNSGYT